MTSALRAVLFELLPAPDAPHRGRRAGLPRGDGRGPDAPLHVAQRVQGRGERGSASRRCGSTTCATSTRSRSSGETWTFRRCRPCSGTRRCSRRCATPSTPTAARPSAPRARSTRAAVHGRPAARRGGRSRPWHPESDGRPVAPADGRRRGVLAVEALFGRPSPPRTTRGRSPVRTSATSPDVRARIAAPLPDRASDPEDARALFALLAPHVEAGRRLADGRDEAPSAWRTSMGLPSTGAPCSCFQVKLYLGAALRLDDGPLYDGSTSRSRTGGRSVAACAGRRPGPSAQAFLEKHFARGTPPSDDRARRRLDLASWSTRWIARASEHRPSTPELDAWPPSRSRGSSTRPAAKPSAASLRLPSSRRSARREELAAPVGRAEAADSTSRRYSDGGAASKSSCPRRARRPPGRSRSPCASGRFPRVGPTRSRPPRRHPPVRRHRASPCAGRCSSTGSSMFVRRPWRYRRLRLERRRCGARRALTAGSGPLSCRPRVPRSASGGSS